MKINNAIIIPVAVAVLVGTAAFWGGMQYQRSRGFAGLRNGGGNQFFQAGAQNVGQGQGFRRNGGPGGNAVAGEIISTDQTGITVKLQDGSSKIIVVPDSATISEATSSSKQALSQGKRVLVFGTQNTDGSVTAQNIQLNMGGMMFGGGRQGAAGGRQ